MKKTLHFKTNTLLKDLVGKDLINDDFNIDLNFDNFASQLHSHDEFLNPSGYLVLNLNSKNIANGVHDLRILLNKNAIYSLKFEYLTPEKWTFSRNDVSWLKEQIQLSVGR